MIRHTTLVTPALMNSFPDNVYLRRLLVKALDLGVSLVSGEVDGQWLYHPGARVLCLWEPDLRQESLSFLVVILAHELGHVIDFDRYPGQIEKLAQIHWTDVPGDYELRAFVNGFKLIEELEIPITLGQYLQMISAPMATMVREMLIESETHLDEVAS